MTTKNEIVLSALEELRISGLTVDPNPKEIVSAIRRLDVMVLGWQNKGLCLGYAKTDADYGVDPDQDSGLKDSDEYAVIMNLAKSLCSMYGKTLPHDTRSEAKSSYLGLFSKDLTMREPSPYLPTGSGQSFGYGYPNRFRYQSQEDNAPVDCSTINIKVGETGTYTHDFTRYLSQIESDEITSYTIDDGQGVSIPASSESEGIITMTAEGLAEGYAPIKITITTTSGRINPETINFNVSER